MLRCSLSLCCTALELCFSCTGGSTRARFACTGRRPRRPRAIYTASHGVERGILPIRTAHERQRNAWSAATRTCSSGDPRSALRLPLRTRGQGDTSPCRLSLWSVRTVSLSAIRKEKWFFKCAVRCLQTGNHYPVPLFLYAAVTSERYSASREDPPAQSAA